MTNPKHTDTSRSGDLKPCPFCGGEAVDFHRANTGATADWCGPVDHWVCCTGECGASTCMHGTKDEAIAAWNNRPADRIEALEAEVERLTQDHRFFAASVLDFHRVCNENRVHGEVLITGEVTAAFNRLYGHVANLARSARYLNLRETDDAGSGVCGQIFKGGKWVWP